MKRILFVIAIIGILFLSGCSEMFDIEEEEYTPAIQYVCPDGSVVNDTSQCKLEEEVVEKEGVYTMREGVSVIVDGKRVELIRISPDGSYVINVDGVDLEIKQTKYTEIVNGLKIRSLSVDYSYTNPYSSSLDLVIEKLVLGENEYLFFIDKPQTMYGKLITLKNVEFSDSSIRVKVEGYNDERVREGYSEKIGEFEITNVDTFPRAIRKENYAILKIIKK